MVKDVWDFFLGALFPQRCLGCGIFDTWMCMDCHGSLALITQQRCPFCTHHTPLGQVCPECTQHTSYALDGIYVASTFMDPRIKKLVHYFKYKFIRELADPIAVLMAQSLQHSELPSPDILVAVPLHSRRKRWRGYNQSQELLEQLDLIIPQSTDNLIRRRFTTSQVSKGKRAKRLKNLHGAFSVIDPSVFAHKNVLLIDDIVTTGTTLNECAKALKKAGAKSVTGFVLARD
jgi:competence protein ComFC